MDWRQTDNRLWLKTSIGEFYADMPDGWKLADVHPAALAVTEWLLCHNIPAISGDAPSTEQLLAGAYRKRPMQERIGLSFSGGVDSMAALMLLPKDTVPIYCRRPYDHYRLPPERGAHKINLAPFDPIGRCLAAVGNAISIFNTFEMMGLAAGGRHGFTDGFGYGAVICLLADWLGLGSIAFGSVLEGAITTHGCFVGINTDRLHRQIFRVAGLDFYLPLAGLSEVATCHIVAAGKRQSIVVPCPSAAADGTPCGTCFKCFRKMRIMGQDAPEPSKSVFKLFAKRPLATAGSTIYACQAAGWWCESLAEYRDVQLEFLERYYNPAIDKLLPFEIATYLRKRLEHFQIEPMSADDEASFENMGATFWPERHAELLEKKGCT